MLIFGFGRKSRTTQIGPGRSLVVTFRYVSLFFLFGLAWGNRYSLTQVQPDGSTAMRRITAEQATEFNGGEPFGPTSWQRFGLLYALAAVLVVIGLFR